VVGVGVVVVVVLDCSSGKGGESRTRSETDFIINGMSSLSLIRSLIK
jgi:hypothetical protein